MDFSIHSRELFPDSFNVFRLDRKFLELNYTRGGGVLVGINNELVSSEIVINTPAFVNPDLSIDIVALKIVSDSDAIYLFNVYIPPNVTAASFEYFFEAIESIE